MLSTDRILGIDIGAASVKIGEFQVTKSSGLKLINFNSAELTSDPEQEENRQAQLVPSIQNLLHERNISTTKAIVSVSGQSVFTKFVRLPPVEESKVLQIIQYEAQQNVPFPIDEVTWDYQLIGNGAEGEVEVVLVAIKTELIEQIISVLESADLNPLIVDVSPMAVYNTVRYNSPQLDGCTIVLDIGARTTNLLFIQNGKIFSRSIPIAGNAITQSIAAEFNITFLDAELLKKSKGFVALGGAYEEPADESQARISKIIRHVMTRLHAEIVRSVNFYRSQQGGNSPSHLLLSGGSSIIPYTDRFFEEKLQIPIEYLNPFRNLEIDPQNSAEAIAKYAHTFGEVVGLGLRQLTECPMEVNLLTKSRQKRLEFTSKIPYVAGALAALLIIPICIWLYGMKVYRLRTEELKTISTHLTQVQQLSTEIRKLQDATTDLQAKADTLVMLVEQQHTWPLFLEDLSSRMVPGIWIVSLQPQFEAATSQTQSPRSTRGRSRRGNSTPQESTESSITVIRIEGAGIHSSTNPSLDIEVVDNFAESLRLSPYFKADTIEIVTPPNPMAKNPIFNFSLRASLSSPIPL